MAAHRLAKTRSAAELERDRLEANAAAAANAFVAARSSAWSSSPAFGNAPEGDLLVALLRPILAEFSLVTRPGSQFAGVSGFGAIDPVSKTIFLNPAAPGLVRVEQYRYVLAHLAAHLGFEHHRTDGDAALRGAQEAVADALVASLGLVEPPAGYLPSNLGADDPERLAEQIRSGTLGHIPDLTMAGPGRRDHLYAPEAAGYDARMGEGFEALLGLRLAALRPQTGKADLAAEARRYIVNHYPLLAAMAHQINIVTDRVALRTAGVELAAVNPRLGEIYLAVTPDLTAREAIFALAHELLHLGLRHADRLAGRDPYVWNLASDLQINSWLLAMGVGTMPQQGLLYDPALAGMSSEAIYDLLVGSPARIRRLRSFRGMAVGDIIYDGTRVLVRGDVSALDDAYAAALRHGLDAHHLRYGTGGRGTLPADLEEEINSLEVDPVPWDVALARWFEEYVRGPLPVRTYARASRRQSSTPDIPRPRWYTPEVRIPAFTFGVVLDSSGSMDRETLARALGAIASYAAERAVAQIRLVMCDAMPYDAGYVDPDALRRAYPVKGRGGTFLSPAVNLLLASPDFPSDAPILVVTDGGFEEELAIPRTHAWILPRVETWWPFRPDGSPVFRVL